jgi:hypothetical protein
MTYTVEDIVELIVYHLIAPQPDDMAAHIALSCLVREVQKLIDDIVAADLSAGDVDDL